MYINIYHQQEIAAEDRNKNHIEHDLKMIDIAYGLSAYEDGWDNLENRCYTQAARSIINQIYWSLEMRAEACDRSL